MRLYDAAGREVGPGEPGRIFVGNEMVFDGYTGGGSKPMRDGLLASGDVGHFDEAGRLFIDGRADEMIVSGGENVFPREVEDLVARLKGVEDVAVIGVDDERFGQRLKAFVVLEAGAELTEQDVKDHVRRGLAAFKVPREVVFLAELPRTETGKVLKRALDPSGPPASPRTLGSPARGGVLARMARSHPSLPLPGERPSAGSTMPGSRTDSFDLGRLRLTSGEGRRLELDVALDALQFGGQPYTVEPAVVTAVLDISAMTRSGYALRLRFDASLRGPCMRCLEPAQPAIAVDAREVDQPGGGDELSSPYVKKEVLDVHAWARDALVLALPAQLLCKEDCLGLCPVCGTDLNAAGPEHAHERGPDPRWAKLSELKLD